MLNSIKLLKLLLLSAGLAAVLSAGCLDQSSDQSSRDDENISSPVMSVTGASLFSESFSSGLGQFTVTGSSTRYTTSSSYGVRMKGGTIGSIYITSKAISTVGYTNITLTFTRATSGLDSGEAGVASYSVDGTNYTTIESVQSASGSSTFTLGSDAAGKSTLYLRFQCKANLSTETYTVDEVQLKGDESGSGTVLISNPKVVMLGDSIFALSGEIANELQRLSGEKYRSYYVSGAEFEGSLISNIPDQYSSAISADSSIRTVIMDGGGNDVQIGASLYCSGSTVSTLCKASLSSALSTADSLFKKMRTNGVTNIVYLKYFYIKDTTKQPAFLYMAAEMEKIALKYNCIIVDPMAIFNAHPEYIGSDDIHPTTEGSQVLANLIWDAMKANNIEQND